MDGGRSSHLHRHTNNCVPLLLFLCCCTSLVFRLQHARTDLAALLHPAPVPFPRADPTKRLCHSRHCPWRQTSFPLLLPVDLPPRQNGRDDTSRRRIGEAPQAQHHNTLCRIEIYRIRIPFFAISRRLSPCTPARDPETPSVPSHTISHARSHVSKARIPPDPTIWHYSHPGTPPPYST